MRPQLAVKRPRLAFLLLAVAACGPSPGAPCTNDSACGEGLRCARPVVDGAPADNGVCSPTLLGENAPCSVTAECAKGLFCSNDIPADVKRRHGTCIPGRSDGAGCFRDNNCAAGLVCLKADDEDTGVCGPKPPPPDAGADEVEVDAGVDAGADEGVDARADAAADS
jgi:hypothetical protein